MQDAGIPYWTDVARLLQVRDSTVSNWRRGKATPPAHVQKTYLQRIRSSGADAAADAKPDAGSGHGAPQNSDKRQLPTFATEAERRASALTLLYFAQELGPQLVATVDKAVLALSGSIVAAEIDAVERAVQSVREATSVPMDRHAER